MKNNKNINDDMWGLLAKYITDEATMEEKQVVEAWIGESDENLREFRQCQLLMEKTDLYFKTRHYNENDAFVAVKEKAIQAEKAGKKVFFTFLKYAAAAVLILSLAFTAYYSLLRKPSVEQLVIQTNIQEQKNVALPDGTIITLNGKTKITYPETFTGEFREIEIEGEAFFDVKPNPEKPFIIAAGNTQIKVVGTSFNVYAYPEEETVEVVVATGKVQITDKSGRSDGTGETLLEPGEKATVTKKDRSIQKKTNDDPNYIAWKTKDFNFEKSLLSYVIATLEKSFQIEIKVADQEIENLKITAQFEDKPVDFILDVIRLTFNLELKVEGDIYYLSSLKP